jgi:hypothetical protein
MNFLHFEKIDGTKVDSAKIAGYQLYGEFFDDIDFKLTIIDGKLKIDLIIDPYFTQDEIDDITDHIKHEEINWNNGYEFLSYKDINDDSDLYLVADENSDIFNIVNSPKNIKNINKVANKMK